MKIKEILFKCKRSDGRRSDRSGKNFWRSFLCLRSFY